MNSDEQRIFSLDGGELLTSEEEFTHPTNQQPSTSFFSNFGLLPTFRRDANLSTGFVIPLQLSDESVSRQESADIPLPMHYISTVPLELPAFTVFSLPIIPPLISDSEFLNSWAWDQWLGCLARSLSPIQWQQYWINYLTLFGITGLPQHLVHFFITAASLNLPSATSSTLFNSISSKNNVNVMDFSQQLYGINFLAS
ncbi:unnamed protein product [Thelazia callipaeda]|uniref:Protein TIC 20 n=1 Tax=Thelazia callipaeda TaxID=103827 RepID=A0A0N5D1Y5_THECL|nr:unnamed protein product [Thelazia callipaeda]